MGSLADGFTCKCGEKHKYPAYVYAHWETRLVFTCPKCQRKYTVRQGKARATTAAKGRKEKAE